MNKDKEIEEASAIVFSIFLKAVKEESSDSIIYEKIKKWGELTLRILNETYPPDIFTGASNDKGVNAVNLIRKKLEEGIKNE